MAGVAVRGWDLVKTYRGTGGRPPVRALRGVSLEVPSGGTLGIVGESGCGKSTLARLLVGLEAPSRGGAEVDGVPVTTRAGDARLQLARRIQLVFQDPFSSLDPRRTVGRTLAEVLQVHRLGEGADGRRQRVTELLEMVALGTRFADRYPHELSGGQAQRVAVARALAVQPGVLVLDEPTSALDVSVRAELLNLLVGMQDRLGLAYVFISHDVSMIRHLSDRILVMYLGKVVEAGPYDAVLDRPLHPYTEALAAAVPVPDPGVDAERRRGRSVGAPVDLREPDRGCPYQPRCPLAEPVCREVDPDLGALPGGRAVACHVAVRQAGASGPS